jgi:hypothetical protein
MYIKNLQDQSWHGDHIYYETSKPNEADDTNILISRLKFKISIERPPPPKSKLLKHDKKAIFSHAIDIHWTDRDYFIII